MKNYPVLWLPAEPGPVAMGLSQAHEAEARLVNS